MCYTEPNQDPAEVVDFDARGRLTINGKVVTDAAVEQRLRRFCSVKKNGAVKSGADIKAMFDNLETRQDLVQMFKDAKLNKDPMKYNLIVSYLVLSYHCAVFNIYIKLQEDLKKRVHQKITKQQEKKVTVKCGWYTEKQMKEVLKMGKLGS